jgi:hypothetical protein
MSPTVKKALSAVAFACAGALLVAAQKSLIPLAPEAAQAALVAGLAAFAHYLDAWGHTDRVEAAVIEANKK